MWRTAVHRAAKAPARQAICPAALWIRG